MGHPGNKQQANPVAAAPLWSFTPTAVNSCTNSQLLHNMVKK
jgi:hypothetical protein